MKDALFMNGGPGFSTITMVFLLLPLLAIIYKRKHWHNSFLSLLICLLLLVFTSLISSGIIAVSEETIFTVNTISALIQPPLVLLFMTYFTNQEQVKKSMRFTVTILLITGILILTRGDFQDIANPVILGLGLLLVNIFSFYFLILQIKASVTLRGETGKAFIVSGIVFAYSCYSFIFVVNYFFNSNNRQDLFTLFEISTFIFAFLAMVGILLNNPVPATVNKTIQKTGGGVKEWEGFTSYN